MSEHDQEEEINAQRAAVQRRSRALRELVLARCQGGTEIYSRELRDLALAHGIDIDVRIAQLELKNMERDGLVTSYLGNTYEHGSMWLRRYFHLPAGSSATAGPSAPSSKPADAGVPSGA